MDGIKRIGLAGAGWVTAHHLAGYRRLADRARVVAIADPKAEARRARAEAHGIPATYATVEEMLDRETLDAVDVAVPREFHAEATLAAVARGLPVLCQKPLAPTLAEAEDLVAKVGDRARLMVHENWRFRPHYRTIRRWIDEGRLGTIQQAQMTVLSSGMIPDAQGLLPAVERQPFFRHEKRLLVAEGVIHHIDTLRFLLGRLALRASRIGKTRTEIVGEDNATLYMTTESGASAVLTASTTAHGWPPGQFDRLELIGDRGAARLVEDTLECFGARPERLALDLDANYIASYRDTIAHFLDGLETGAPFETAPEDNLETLRIVERVYAEAGR